MKIDASWYQRPPASVPRRTAAGGIVVRPDPTAPSGILGALVNEPRATNYVLPKGGVERGETLEQAARREIAEEAGLTQLDLLADLGHRGRFNYERTHWVTTHYFLFRTSQVEAHPTDRHHHYQTTWFDIAQLPKMLWPDQRTLIESNVPLIRSFLLATDGARLD